MPTDGFTASELTNAVSALNELRDRMGQVMDQTKDALEISRWKEKTIEENIDCIVNSRNNSG